jgi:hypothetical protein
MGIGGISIWQLLIVLVIIVLLFGIKKIKKKLLRLRPEVSEAVPRWLSVV